MLRTSRLLCSAIVASALGAVACLPGSSDRADDAGAVDGAFDPDHDAGIVPRTDAGGACQGIDCSGHGQCTVAGTMVVCACDGDYHPVGLECVANSAPPCQGVDCSGHGSCAVADGIAVCTCDQGYHDVGLACVPD